MTITLGAVNDSMYFPSRAASSKKKDRLLCIPFAYLIILAAKSMRLSNLYEPLCTQCRCRVPFQLPLTVDMKSFHLTEQTIPSVPIV